MNLVKLLTKDGVMTILCEKDQYGCVKAVMSVNDEKPWAELFADIEEFKEFIDNLPIIEGISYEENYEFSNVA